MTRNFTKYPSSYIKAGFDTEYYYYIFESKDPSESSIASGRADSLGECQAMLDYYNIQCGHPCVISVKELSTIEEKWICRRASKV